MSQLQEENKNLKEQNVKLLKMCNRAKTIIGKSKTLMPNIDWVIDFDNLNEEIGNSLEVSPDSNEEDHY
jgi:hypothetical protein